MEVIRDLIRDLVGIIFPGSFLVFTAICFLISLLFLVYPMEAIVGISALLNSSGAFFIFLAFSYIAGQSLRIKQLEDLESECTELYRKTFRKGKTSTEEYETSLTEVKEAERAYLARRLTREKLKEVFAHHIERFGLWEKFPYSAYLKLRRLRANTKSYNDFFEKYEKQGITNDQAFFHFCLMVVYEYSTSLKEELLRQEALIRLFAGMFYALKFGRGVSVIVAALHSAAFLTITFGNITFLPYLQDKNNAGISASIAIVSLLAYILFEYLRREILKRLRPMRVKEVRMAYESFYLLSTKHELDY